MTARTNDREVERLVREIGDVLVRAKLDRLNPGVERLDLDVVGRVSNDCIDTAGYYFVSEHAPTRAAADDLRETGMILAKIGKANAAKIAARETTRLRAREEAERAAFTAKIEELFPDRKDRTTGQPAREARSPAPSAPYYTLRTKEGTPMTKNDQHNGDDGGLFERLREQQTGWTPTWMKKAAEADAQRALDSLAEQARQRQEREVEAARIAAQRSAEAVEAERSRWRRGRRKDPLRG
jgi:hypothetical protein